MAVSRTKIAEVVAKRTLSDDTTKNFAKEIAAYLLAENRTSELDSLLRDVQISWIDDGFVEVLASSAHGIDETSKVDILTRVKSLYPGAEKYIITEAIDPNLIGGARISIADKRLDLTIDAKLNKFKQITTAGKE